jgi:hypothetical protein
MSQVWSGYSCQGVHPQPPTVEARQLLRSCPPIALVQSIEHQARASREHEERVDLAEHSTFVGQEHRFAFLDVEQVASPQTSRSEQSLECGWDERIGRAGRTKVVPPTRVRPPPSGALEHCDASVTMKDEGYIEHGSVVLEAEAHLQANLEVFDCTVDDVATYLRDLEPVDPADC